MKVYCDDCKHLKAHRGRLECHFNSREIAEDYPMQPLYHTEFEDFQVKNKDNNCSDYKRSKLRFWK